MKDYEENTMEGTRRFKTHGRTRKSESRKIIMVVNIVYKGEELWYLSEL